MKIYIPDITELTAKQYEVMVRDAILWRALCDRSPLQTWKIVPVIPTKEQVDAGMKEDDGFAGNIGDYINLYVAMVKAAPKQPESIIDAEDWKWAL